MSSSDGTRPDPARGDRTWSDVVAVVVVVVLVGLVAVVVALAPPAPPTRAQALAEQLRCPVCQGISVAESRSETALAMQERIREMVDAGATDAEVLDHFVTRYGSWVVLDPSRSGAGLLLWILPGVALFGGGILARSRRRDRHARLEVDEQLRERVRAIVEAENRDRPGGPQR